MKRLNIILFDANVCEINSRSIASHGVYNIGTTEIVDLGLDDMDVVFQKVCSVFSMESDVHHWHCDIVDVANDQQVPQGLFSSKVVSDALGSVDDCGRHDNE